MRGNGGRAYPTERGHALTLRVVSGLKGMSKGNDEVLEAAMSRSTSGFPLGDIVVLTAALAALAACSRGAVAPPSDSVPVVSSGTPAAHVREQPTPTAFPSDRTTAHAISSEFGNPERVAIAEARAVCNFDWRKSLAARITGARKYATDAYARALTPSANDMANWMRTQHDRESATCTELRAFALSGAPNTASVRYERVEMTQVVQVRGQPRPQQFEVSYRVERQYDGRWLVGAEGDGG